MPSQPRKAERLFRAAVSAFCSLPRPSRSEIAQLEDLTLPLFDEVSTESKRFVAAALSESDSAPPALVRRLANESIDIAAPLLIRSQALTDIDLIALIGRHGMAHARAIARRQALNPTISSLIQALDRPAPSPTGERRDDTSADPVPDSGWSAERVRQRLRAMMEHADKSKPAFDPSRAADNYPRLLRTALSGTRAFFQTALADALDIDFSTARAIVPPESCLPLMVALKSMGLAEERAFLLAAAVYPRSFDSTDLVRMFVESYALLDIDTAVEQLHEWRLGQPVDPRLDLARRNQKSA